MGWCSSDETCGFCISSAPHGSAAGRERPRCLISNLRAHRRYWRVFCGRRRVSDLLPEQRPGAVLARDYIATFKLLSLYDIDQCWLCADSARERGLGSRDPVGGGCRMPGAGCPARPSA
ncbi:DsrE family protein [Klebsiella pneumoniae]